jgi:hypothetical protein
MICITANTVSCHDDNQLVKAVGEIIAVYFKKCIGYTNKMYALEHSTSLLCLTWRQLL